jgi:hypothetical protein
MPPSISPNSLGTGVGPFTIAGTKAVYAAAHLPVTGSDPTATVRIDYPTAAAPTTAQLIQGTNVIALLPGPISGNTANAGRQVDVTSGAGGTGMTRLTITFTYSGGGSDDWQFRLVGATPQTFRLEITTPSPHAFTQIVSDPVADLTITRAGVAITDALENTAVDLAATPVSPAGAPTALGTAPTAQYGFRSVGPVALTSLPASPGPAPSLALAIPPLKHQQSVQLFVDVSYTVTWSADPLTASSAGKPLQLKLRPHQLAIVVDRSGSMWGARWDNAVTAAKMAAHLFTALRANGSPDDRVGILVFEDTVGGWRTSGVDPKIKYELALAAPGSAVAQICPKPLGNAGAATPIGDGLRRAYDGLPNPSVPGGVGPRRTLLLLTDGYENSGTLKIDENSPPAGIQVYGVPTDAVIFAIGLGDSVQEDVLDALTRGFPDRKYQSVLDVNEIGTALTQAAGMASGGDQIAHSADTSPPDPTPPAHARYFHLPSLFDLVAAAVEWTSPTDTLELAWRAAGSSSAFTPLTTATLRQCQTFGFISAPKPAAASGGTDWRIVRMDKPGNAQQIAPTDLIVWEDLRVRADFFFDDSRYHTGQPMTITARLRADGDPIPDARITVELARPGQSLGTFLATNSSGFKYQQGQTADAKAPKAALIDYAKNKHDISQMPVVEPPGFFADRTVELWDDGAHGDGLADDGDFANSYLDTDVEGTYTFRFYVQGRLPDGSSFTRVRTISRWVGVAIDTASTKLSQSQVASPVQGMAATQITVKPQDALGNLLGPFRTKEFKITVAGGKLATPLEDLLDGRYNQVIVYKRGTKPKVTVTIGGQRFKPIVIGQREKRRPGPGDRDIIRRVTDVRDRLIDVLRRRRDG